MVTKLFIPARLFGKLGVLQNALPFQSVIPQLSRDQFRDR
jgi:hypothetical protein